MKMLIVGAGLAAQRCCAALRRLGHDGPITVIGGEPQLPYDRPPLSKEALASGVDDAALLLRAPAWYAEHDIDMRLGTPAAALDHRSRTVTLAGGGAPVPYDRLLIATGANARRLPGCEQFANMHVLRSIGDAVRLRADLKPGARLVIVGAGFIGLEVASTARARGVEVTLVDTASVPLAAIVGPRLGEWFADMHRQAGVRLLMGSCIEAFHGTADRIQRVALGGGEQIECDAVLAGIGVSAATGWLEGTPLHASAGGIAVDAAGASAIEHVFAAGDVARPFDPATGRHERSEHWDAAAQTGAAAARGMLGLTPTPARPSSFWSDQYATRFQLVGNPQGADDVLIDGDPASRDFTALYARDGVLVAGLLAGRPRALPALRAHLGQPIPERKTA